MVLFCVGVFGVWLLGIGFAYACVCCLCSCVVGCFVLCCLDLAGLM